jgi:hypothetical protein
MLNKVKSRIAGEKLEKNQMKKLMGGLLPGGYKLWRCLTDPSGPWYDNVCYAVQPQGPCGYSQPCSQIGTCTKAMCIY